MRKFRERAGTERRVLWREGRGRERAGPKKARRGRGEELGKEEG